MLDTNLKLPLIWLLEFVKPLYLQCSEWSFRLYSRIRESFDVIRIWNITIRHEFEISNVIFMIYDYFAPSEHADTM